MRVRIIFTLKNKGAAVPFHHQYLLAALAENLYAEMGPVGGREHVNFSALKGQTRVSKTGLHFYSARVTLVFSSPEVTVIDRFLHRIFARPEIAVGDLQLVPEAVEREELPPFTESVKCVCISPVVLTAAGSVAAKKFVPPESDLFSDLLYESTMARMEASGRYSAEEIASFFRFQVVPDKDYLSRIREGEKKFARIYPIETPSGPAEVRGYTFPFTLFAAPPVQEFLFGSGLGYCTGRGFGMLDLANAEQVRKTERYQPRSSAEVA